MKTSLLITSLLVGLSGCAQDVEFDGRGLDVHGDLKAVPVTVPQANVDSYSSTIAPARSPQPQCLGQLTHPTYRRDLPPQPEAVKVEIESGCDVANGVLYRFSSPSDFSTRIAPTVDLHGIGI
ncbi:MAG: hypothetical protein V3T39_07290 [Gammaproteobacteria bacterium]